MIRIAICDDSSSFLQQISLLIEHWDKKPQNMITELFEDGDSLIRAHEQNPFDIILLDIVMPLFNGIETAAEIRIHDKAVKIVFITSSPEYAVDSYSVKASNYLLKPLDPSKLFRCLEELISDIVNTEHFITAKYGNAMHRINLAELEYVEAQGKHIRFVLSDASSILSTDPLYAHENILTTEGVFFKCHRSYFVNLHYINNYTHKEITMRSGSIIPISRNCYKSFEAAYFSMLFTKAGE